MKVKLIFLMGSLAALIIAGGAWATLADPETSGGNSISAGILDLGLWAGTQDPQNPDSVIKTWELSNMIPGVSQTGLKFVTMENRGNVEGASVDIKVSNECVDPGAEIGTNEDGDTLDGADGMDRYMQILFLKFSNKNLLWTGIDNPNSDEDDPATPWNEIDDVNGNGYADLEDFASQPLIGVLPAPHAEPYYTQTFWMQVRFHESATNEYQGDKVNTTVAFTLNQ